MRIDSAAFHEKNTSLDKEPRYTIEVAFDAGNTVLHYFTSHLDAEIPPGGAATYGVISGLSGATQTINPDKAISTIGNISFSVVDKNNAVRDLQFTKYQLGYSLRGMRVRVYCGFKGLDWADYSLIQTQIVDSVTYKDGRYNFLCSDVQRLARKDIFDAAKTNLFSKVSATDTTITVYSTADFQMVAHGASYSDAPNATVGYIRIDDEVIRYTGKNDTTFTGCKRGALNTKAAEHTIDPNATADRRTKVEEFIYLEMPAPKLIYALLTGDLYGQGATLPDHWNLGIQAGYVRASDFTGVGSDWWIPADDTKGVRVRFEGLKKEDGKTFIETELLLLLGAFMPVYTDGALGLKRMVRILTDAPYSDILDEKNVISHSELKHDFQALHNVIKIDWNYNVVKDSTTRTNVLIDPDSIAVHGKAKPYEHTFKGLHAEVHTLATLNNRFDALRDRYSGPPLRLSAVCLPSTNQAEVGDVKRVRLDSLHDFTTGSTIDRSFEVQNVATDWITGKVTLSLFSSSQEAAPIEWSGNATNLADEFYTSAGHNLATYIGGGYDSTTDFLESGGIGHIVSACQLTGGSTTADAIYYYDGPLQIDASVIVTITQNVQIRCKGFFTINGTIDGAGKGLAGVAGAATYNQYGDGWHSPGIAGIGKTKPGGGIAFSFIGLGVVNSREGKVTDEGQVQKHDLVNDAGTLVGTPLELRGTSGGGGLPVNESETLRAAGGAGGSGGAGLLLVCRGLAIGAAGSFDLSGGDGSQGTRYTVGSFDVYSGTGAGGYPGVLYIVNDGTDVVDQITPNNFAANRGASVPKGTPMTEPYSFNLALDQASSYYTGYYGADRSHVASNFRLDYVPANETAEPDQTEYPPDVTNFTAFQNGDVTVLKWDPVSYDGDLGGYEIRWSPITINSFADATPLTVETKGSNITTADLPPGAWRIYNKAVDRITKNKSVNAATATVTVTSSFNVIYQTQQAPSWPGTLTNFVRHHTGKLVVESTKAANAHTNAELFEQHVPYPQAQSVYESLEYDIDFDDTVRSWGDIDSVLGPGKTGIANPQLQLDSKLSAGAYDGFENWSNGLVTARFIKHRIVNDNTNGVVVVNGFRPTVDILEHTEKKKGVVIAIAGTTVTFDKPFHTNPIVKLFMYENSAKQPVIDPSTVTTTSFKAYVYALGTGADVGGQIQYEATGE